MRVLKKVATEEMIRSQMTNRSMVASLLWRGSRQVGRLRIGVSLYYLPL